MNTSSSAEDYLEIILRLTNKWVRIRAIDIVNEIGYSRASVSIAMRKLREQSLVNVDTDGYISLTEMGKYKALKVYNRHTVLSDWLISIGVDKEIAASDACRMEHILSDKTFEAIKNLYEAR
jgi:Mn-dependent DtxR family transcriptional regulator